MKHNRQQSKNDRPPIIILPPEKNRTSFDANCGLTRDELLNVIDEAIATCHHMASPSGKTRSGRTIWRLETHGVRFYYQILTGAIEIGKLTCDGADFLAAPTNDWLDDWIY